MPYEKTQSPIFYKKLSKKIIDTYLKHDQIDSFKLQPNQNKGYRLIHIALYPQLSHHYTERVNVNILCYGLNKILLYVYKSGGDYSNSNGYKNPEIDNKILFEKVDKSKRYTIQEMNAIINDILFYIHESIDPIVSPYNYYERK